MYEQEFTKKAPFVVEIYRTVTMENQITTREALVLSFINNPETNLMWLAWTLDWLYPNCEIAKTETPVDFLITWLRTYFNLEQCLDISLECNRIFLLEGLLSKQSYNVLTQWMIHQWPKRNSL